MWGGQITQYINEQIRKGKDVTVYSENGAPLTITKDTAGKAAYWNTDQYGNRIPASEYALKLRIESHIDEAAQVSVGKGKRANDYKAHQFARDGFNYRVAYFRDFDGKYYQFQISVGSNNGINSIYNVNEIENEAGAPDELGGSLPQMRRLGTTSKQRIVQKGNGVKRSVKIMPQEFPKNQTETKFRFVQKNPALSDRYLRRLKKGSNLQPLG